MATTGSDHFGLFAQYGENIASWSESVSWLAMALGPVAIGFGITMWLFGGRMMRPGVVVAGGLAGGWFGATQLPALWGGIEPVVGGVMCMLLGVVLGFVLFRLSVAVLLAVVLGLAAPVGVGLAMDMHRSVNGSGEHGALSEDFLLLRGVPIDDDDDNRDTPPQRSTHDGEEVADDVVGIEALARDAKERAYAFAAALTDEVGERWRTIDERNRRALFAACVVGAFAGFIGGVMAPRFAAGGVTAGAGAALWLGAGVWTLRSVRPDDADRLPTHALAWLAIWFVVALIGAMIQWMPIARTRRKAKMVKAAPAQAPKPEA